MATDNRGRKLPKGIRQRSKDGFEGRFTYQHKTYTVHGETVTKTQKAMTELKYKLEHGIYADKKKITLNDWFTTWMEEYKKNQVKKGTYTSYQNYYKCAIKEKLGDKLISDIRGEHIQKLYNDLVEEEYTLSSIKVIKAILNSSLKQAVKNGLIERNPVPLATLPRQQEKKDRQAMTKEQQALFMEYAKDSYLYNLFAVMLRTGMRSGEMLGLKYTDIDKRKNVIHVKRTLYYANGEGYVEDAPKTKTSLRDVPMTAATQELLEDQRKYWGFKVERLDRYLFCNENGDPLSRARIQREIDQITKRITAAGHEFPHITAHVFRHTFATRAIEAGMQPQVLKTILGHSSLAMTMDLYSHVLPDTKADEMEKIANVF
ncbi:MAG: site-specific integrase [Bariatricus sp.]|nr:site-specific integrase [Bariatricus sp.]